ncbi:MAG: hypothetical protein Q9186_005945 [Xanthomendoza sp. 1 TL-2023]
MSNDSAATSMPLPPIRQLLPSDITVAIDNMSIAERPHITNPPATDNANDPNANLAGLTTAEQEAIEVLASIFRPPGPQHIDVTGSTENTTEAAETLEQVDEIHTGDTTEEDETLEEQFAAQDRRDAENLAAQEKLDEENQTSSLPSTTTPSSSTTASLPGGAFCFTEGR